MNSNKTHNIKIKYDKKIIKIKKHIQSRRINRYKKVSKNRNDL